REARDVEDLLLRVHRGDLPAELRQRVDHRHPEAAEARVVRREQAGRPCPDDRQVGLELCHAATFPHFVLLRHGVSAHRVWTLSPSQPPLLRTIVTSARRAVNDGSPSPWRVRWSSRTSACTWSGPAWTTPDPATLVEVTARAAIVRAFTGA